MRCACASSSAQSSSASRSSSSGSRSSRASSSAWRSSSACDCSHRARLASASASTCGASACSSCRKLLKRSIAAGESSNGPAMCRRCVSRASGSGRKEPAGLGAFWRMAVSLPAGGGEPRRPVGMRRPQPASFAGCATSIARCRRARTCRTSPLLMALSFRLAKLQNNAACCRAARTGAKLRRCSGQGPCVRNASRCSGVG